MAKIASSPTTKREKAPGWTRELAHQSIAIMHNPTRVLVAAICLAVSLVCGPTALAQNQMPQYDSVDEILLGTRFQDIDLDTYEAAIQNGRIIVFHYNNDFPNAGNGRVAQVLREASVDAPDSILFLALRYEQGKDNEYLRLGFTGTPNIAVYVNGDRVEFDDTSPLDQEEVRRVIPLMKRFFVQLVSEY